MVSPAREYTAEAQHHELPPTAATFRNLQPQATTRIASRPEAQSQPNLRTRTCSVTPWSQSSRFLTRLSTELIKVSCNQTKLPRSFRLKRSQPRRMRRRLPNLFDRLKSHASSMTASACLTSTSSPRADRQLTKTAHTLAPDKTRQCGRTSRRATLYSLSIIRRKMAD